MIEIELKDTMRLMRLSSKRLYSAMNVSRHKRLTELDELSGHTTGRLGYTWPTTAYAIGGTETLTLRYSIISATVAARTLPRE